LAAACLHKAHLLLTFSISIRNIKVNEESSYFVIDWTKSGPNIFCSPYSMWQRWYNWWQTSRLKGV